MELHTKSLNRDEWKRVTKKINRHLIVEDDCFCGTVGCLKIVELTAPLVIEYDFADITIADKGYTWIQFAPRDKNYWLTVMFDEKNELVEGYFDITRENVFDDESNPYFIDMKLDVVIASDGVAYIIDGDELREAFDGGIIT